MTLIPQLEADLLAAAERVVRPPAPRVPWVRRRGLALSFAVLLALGGVAGGAALVTHEGPPIKPAPRGDFPRGVQFPAPGTGVIAATAPDPGKLGPPWAIRLARSAEGSPCVAVGRFLTGRLGRSATRRDSFRALPLRGPGSCGVSVGPRKVAWFMNEY